MSSFDFETELIKVYPDMENFSYRYKPPLQEFEREDLFHETVLKILEKRHMFKIEGDYQFSKFRGWCCRIMNNLFINNFRVNKRNRVDSYDENPLLLFSNEPITFSADENLLSSEMYNINIKFREKFNQQENLFRIYEWYAL